MFENRNLKNLNADAEENAAADNAADSTATTNVPVGESGTAGAAQTETAVEEVAVAPKYAPETAHDDFDWNVDKRNVTSYI